MYDAILFVSFGGPEGPDDVMPFLENVLRGKNVPRERMLEVAEHYMHFDGISPINEQCRDLIAALRIELAHHQIHLPIFWGNRNWNPLLTDTFQEMKEKGVKRAIAFFTSTFSSYSGCRQYRENIAAAQEAIGEGATQVDKLRMPYNHPSFIQAQVDCLKKAFEKIPEELRATTPVLFCAHSIPNSMADNCNYQRQLLEASRLTAEACGVTNWELTFQSRSGPPTQPWLEPDVGDRIRELHTTTGIKSIVLQPIGFLSDHMEVLYDLDEEAAEVAKELDIAFSRAPTVGVHPAFVAMIRELIQERMNPAVEKRAIGKFGPNHDVCPVDCCLMGARGRPAASPN